MENMMRSEALSKPARFDLSFRIVKMLATSKNGMTFYNIEAALSGEGVKSSHGTLHSIVKTLLKDKFIKIVKTEPFKTGLTKKFYGITPEGFNFAFKRMGIGKSEWDPAFFFDNILLISQAHPELSPILKKVPEWKMESTPGLLRAFIAACAENSFESPEDVAKLAAMMILIGEKEKIVRALGFDPDEEWGFANINDDMKSLRKELRVFAKNNPWILADLRKGAANVSKKAIEDAKYLEQQAKEFEQLSHATDEQLLMQLKK